MKTKTFYWIIITTTVVITLFSCNSDKKDWEKIKNSNNRLDFVVYLNHHPKKEFRLAATKRLNFIDDSLDFERIKKEFSIKSCNNYIKSNSGYYSSTDKGYFIEECKKLKIEIKESWQSELSDVDTIFYEFKFANTVPRFSDIENNIRKEVNNKLDTLDIEMTSIINFENNADIKMRIVFDGIALSKVYNIYSTTKTSGTYGKTEYNNYTERQYSGAITKGQVIVLKKDSIIFNSKRFYKKTSPPSSFEQESYDSPESAPFHIEEFKDFAIKEINDFFDMNTKAKKE